MIRYLSCLHSRSRDQHSVGGHPREVRWTVTPSEGRTLTEVTQEKCLLFLCLDLFCRLLCLSPSLLISPPSC